MPNTRDFRQYGNLTEGSVSAGTHQIFIDDDVDRFLQDWPTNSPIRSAYNFWKVRTNPEDGLPRREELDPLELGPGTLPHIVLLDIERTPELRFRYSLVGGHVEEIFGENYAGRYLDEMDLGTMMEVVTEFYKVTATRKTAALLQAGYITKNRSTFKVIRLAMPMAWRADPVGAIFCAFE